MKRQTIYVKIAGDGLACRTTCGDRQVKSVTESITLSVTDGCVVYKKLEGD